MYSIDYMKELQKKNGTFFEGFVSKSDIEYQFNIKDPTILQDATILMAVYETEWYEGDAFVLYIEDDKLYEVNGSHCSCYGLEDQWNPEEALLEELARNRFVKTYRFSSIPHIRKTLEEVIGFNKQDPPRKEFVDPLTDLELN